MSNIYTPTPAEVGRAILGTFASICHDTMVSLAGTCAPSFNNNPTQLWTASSDKIEVNEVLRWGIPSKGTILATYAISAYRIPPPGFTLLLEWELADTEDIYIYIDLTKSVATKARATHTIINALLVEAGTMKVF